MFAEMATRGIGGEREITSHHLSDLRLVLLGGESTGKSCSGNTILGRKEFQTGIGTKECVKSQSEVAGRQVTVVDTPGWAWCFILHSVEQLEQKLVRSLSLCSPGPHALLLVIPVGYVTEDDRKAVEEHLKLFSETVWRHTIVLFTKGDRLKQRTIEQHIEQEGRDLQQIVEKCGNRYHVFNNENKGDCTQVTELLQKIEQMVAANGSSYYLNKMYQVMEEIIRLLEDTLKERNDDGDREKIKKWYEKREEEVRQRYEEMDRKREHELKEKFEEEWNRREKELMEKRNTLKQVEQKKEKDESDLSVKSRNGMDPTILMSECDGATPKREVGETAIEKQELKQMAEEPLKEKEDLRLNIRKSLQEEELEKEMEHHNLLVNGRINKHGSTARMTQIASGELRIVLLGGTMDGKSSTGNTLLGRDEFKANIVGGTKECEKRQGEVSGRQVIVVDTPGWSWDSINLTPIWVKEKIVQSVSLCPPGPHALLVVFPVDYVRETDRKSMEEHLNLLGERVWKYTILLITCGYRLGNTSIEEHIEKWEPLQQFIQKCGNRYHVLENKNGGNCTQVTELLEKIEDMVAGNNGNYYCNDI
ncbi:GTPase IMAP family member 8 isoform X1 [Amia ocellicauda]|uniref:GTPase IMAP family member 8 isoform X1 n=1 Tax=Amia ocellicauda TaxID=2972642 RepID=UPI003463DBAB